MFGQSFGCRLRVESALARFLQPQQQYYLHYSQVAAMISYLFVRTAYSQYNTSSLGIRMIRAFFAPPLLAGLVITAAKPTTAALTLRRTTDLMVSHY